MLGLFEGLAGVDAGELASGDMLVPVFEFDSVLVLVLGGTSIASGHHLQDVLDQLRL